MANTIVFGTTLTAECRPLAEVAARLAQRMNAQLRLVHVLEDSRAPIVLGTDEEHILGPVRAPLHEEAERLRALTRADVHEHLAAGAVIDALVSVAQFELASVLLLGGGAHASRNLLGATAERASRKSAVPVLTLRDPQRLLSWLRAERPLRVLVGADLGRAAESARAFAATLASLGPVECQVVLVASPEEVHARLALPPPTAGLAREAEDALLRDLARSAPPSEAGAVLRVVAGRGSADAHLVGLADQGNFDLVVVGQRRHSLLEQLWYGSVARGVLRASPVSVASVPPTAAAPKPVFREPRVVLAGADFSDVAGMAISQAMGMVADRGTVHLAHVLAPTSGSETDARQARQEAWYALSKLVIGGAAGEREATLERHILEGLPAEQLLALADRVGADLIVLGARNQSVVSRTLLGSVAQSVTESAKVPVLLVPLPAS